MAPRVCHRCAPLAAGATASWGSTHKGVCAVAMGVTWSQPSMLPAAITVKVPFLYSVTVLAV